LNKQNDLSGASPVATPTTRLASISAAGARSARTSRSLTVMRSESWRATRRSGTGHGQPWAVACTLRGRVRRLDWQIRPAADHGTRHHGQACHYVCKGLLPAPIRSRRGFVRDHADGGQGLSWCLIQGGSDIYAFSTETNCGPKMRPPLCPP
jgi:hypothetical protein